MTKILSKKALILSYLTVGYNIAEGTACVLIGSITSSIALVSFGIDSFIESLSGGVMIWRFRRHESLTEEQVEKMEQKAVKLVGYCFVVLGFYVLYESITKLYFQEKPETNIIGIAISILSLIIMPILFYMKHDTGHKLNSRSLIADSRQTLLCIMMSIILFIGLGLNYFYGIWWADPVAGIIMAFLIFKEGYSALKKKELCTC